MRRGGLLLLALLPALVSVAVAQDEVPADAYATVGSSTILRDRVKAETKRGTPAQALQRLIHVEFMRANLAQDGVEVDAVTDAQLREGIDEVTANLAKGGITFETFLERTGQTEAQFRSTFRASYAMLRHVRGLVTEAETRELFASEALRLEGEIRASHIVVKVGAGRSDPAAKARALELHAQLAKSNAAGLGAAFAKLASKASDDPMAPLSGGDLDWFGARGRPGIPSSVLGAAFDHGKTGLLPAPVRGRAGWHVVLVTGVNVPKGVTYETLLPQLRKRAATARAQRLLTHWKERTPIRYAPDAPRDR